ncbi:hypothetical protein DFR50_11745, partial [Roseiarcus fermentans]
MTTKTWKTLSGNWSNATNWNPAAIPVAGDAVVINTASPVTVTFDSGAPSVSVNSLTVGNDTFDLAGGNTLTITGSASFGGLLEIDAGTLNLGAVSATAASFAQTGGALSGAGTLTVSGAASFSGGGYDQQTGKGTTLLQGVTTDSSDYVALDGGRVLENAGTFNVNAATANWGNFYLGYNYTGTTVGGGAIKNDSGATFDFQSASTVSGNTGTTGFTNAGTLEQTITTGTTDIAVALTNTGAVSVQTGTLQLDGGGSASSTASFAIASGAALDFDAGTFTLSGAAFSGVGVAELTGGVLSVAAATTIGSGFAQSAGAIAGTGTLTVSGAAAFTGGGYDQQTGKGTTLLQGVTTDSSYYVALDGGRTLENAGTFNVNATTAGWGNFYLGYNYTGTTVGGGAIKNDSGATFDFQSATSVTSNTGTTGFTNAGTLEQTVTTGTTDIAVALTNTGVVSAQTGTLQLDGGGSASSTGSFVIASGAALDFDAGTFTLSGAAFSGTGVAELTGGVLSVAAATTIGSGFVQSAGAIAGTAKLTVSGAAAFTGGNYDQETGTGTTLLSGVTTDSSYYVALDGGRTLENAGTFNVNATTAGWGNFYLGYNFTGTTVGGGAIKNDSGATFDFQSA